MGDMQVFLVRVWQHLSQFRASVRGIDQEEPRLFDEPHRLGEFLRAASEASSTKPPLKRPGAPGEGAGASEGSEQEDRG